jgi:hypothetical protein
MSRNGFEIFDRYDFAMCMLMDALMAGALVLGAALWVLVPIMFVCCVIVFIRHFDEIMGP